MNTRAIATLLLLSVSAHTAFGMSLRDAGENLLYFEHARLSAEHCEKQGVSVRGAYAVWQKENMPVYRQSTDAIRAQGAQGGLSKSEQESVLSAAIENQRQLAQDNIARKGVVCNKYAAVLTMYSTLLKR